MWLLIWWNCLFPTSIGSFHLFNPIHCRRCHYHDPHPSHQKRCNSFHCHLPIRCRCPNLFHSSSISYHSFQMVATNYIEKTSYFIVATCEVWEDYISFPIAYFFNCLPSYHTGTTHISYSSLSTLQPLFVIFLSGMQSPEKGQTFLRLPIL